jgi:hypothetical protein
MRATVHPNILKGEQVAPASKSSMQRACAAALLHHGTTKILNPGHSNDDLAAIDVIQKLGAIVKTEEALNEKMNTASMIVQSDGVKPIGSSMNCGESGLGIRMFTPIAALSDQTITIEGKGSLLKRPMHFFGLWGTVSFLFGLMIFTYLSISKFFLDKTGMTERPLFFFAILAMIMGTQLFLAGFIGELISRNSPERNNYLIEQKIGL